MRNTIIFFEKNTHLTEMKCLSTLSKNLLFLCYVANPGSLDVCEKVQRYVVGIKAYK